MWFSRYNSSFNENMESAKAGLNENDFAENYSIIITDRSLKEKPSPAIFLFSSKLLINFTKNEEREGLEARDEG